MNAVSSTGSIPTKRVRVNGIEDTDSNEDILQAALDFTGETRSSLFGWDVRRQAGGECVVSLYTD